MLDPITDMQFLPRHNLIAWCPKGILDFAMASRTVEFLMFQEHVLDEPFNRFSDWSMISEVHLNLEQVDEFAAKRRKTYGNGPAVRSAFFAPTLSACVVAHMFAELMKSSPIEVKVFTELSNAAKWLGAPLEDLQLAD